MLSHKYLPKLQVKITRINDNKQIVIDIYSHYTCITGDSGIGKTFFFDTVRRGVNDGRITINSDYPVVFVEDAGILEAILRIPERNIIIVDEQTVVSQQSALMNEINRSQHLFICIGRSFSCRGDYPLQGIYTIKTTSDGDWFEIFNEEIFDISDRVEDVIFTESAKSRSEYEVLKYHFKKVIPCFGRNNIPSRINNVKERFTIFADLGNIGRAFSLLKAKSHGNFNLYDYQSFEQLVYYSPLVKQKEKEDPFIYYSIEKMYENMLEDAHIGYHRKGALAESIIDASKNQTLFDSDLGKGILNKLSDSGSSIKKSNAFGR